MAKSTASRRPREVSLPQIEEFVPPSSAREAAIQWWEKATAALAEISFDCAALRSEVKKETSPLFEMFDLNALEEVQRIAEETSTDLANAYLFARPDIFPSPLAGIPRPEREAAAG